MTHTRGLVQYSPFRDWLISLSITSTWFIHVVTCDRTISFFSKAEKHLIVYVRVCVCVGGCTRTHTSHFVYLFLCEWALRLISPLGYCEYRCSGHGCANITPLLSFPPTNSRISLKCIWEKGLICVRCLSHPTSSKSWRVAHHQVAEMPSFFQGAQVLDAYLFCESNSVRVTPLFVGLFISFKDVSHVLFFNLALATWWLLL